MAENTCPSNDQLRQYVLGNLHAERLISLANHLDACHRCRERMEALEPQADVLLYELRARSGPDPFDQEPELQNAMSALLSGKELRPPSPYSKVELPPEFGRYRIVKELGAGAMGTVYLANDTRLERQVALKIPHLRPKDNSKLRARFLRESKAAAAVHHPNICPIFEAGEIDGIFFFAMPFVDGELLSSVIECKRLMEIQDAVRLVKKIAVAMQEAHNRGVIHRDLKPDNILINRRGEPVVTDFGLASRNEELVEEARLSFDGMLIGSPAYMSPEQVNGEIAQFGPSCDIYSLGVILFELLTGACPFEGNVTSVLAQISRDAPPPPSSRNPTIPASLDTICLRAMAKQPAMRFSSMSEFAERLDDFLAGRLDGEPGRLSQFDGAPTGLDAQTKIREVAFPIDELASRPTLREFFRSHLLLTILLLLSSVSVFSFLAAYFYLPQDGTMQFDVSLDDAEVYVDEILLSPEELSRPLVLKPGQHTWLVKKDGIVVNYKGFTVQPGAAKTLRIPY